MKKLLFFAAMMFGLASCQTEPEGLDVIVGGEVDTVVTVSLPETTRATSADSGIKNVDNTDYRLRYILEVYDTAGDTFVYRDVQTVATDVKTVSFPVRLIPERNYNFVVWADIVDADKANVENWYEADLYYNTAEGLDAISIITEDWNAMDEARDAYTGNEIVTGYNSGKSINITLTRPFGKLRVVTTDIEALKKLANNALPKAVSVVYNTEVYSGFNALTQTATNPADATFAYNLADVYHYVEANATSLTLFTDYIFGTTTGTIQFEMTVTYENDNVATNNFNTEIPVKRNYLTTITGDILTDGNNIKVDVKDGFENGQNPNTPPYYQEAISSEADLIAAINGQGGEYIVVSDIVVTGNSASTLAATRAAGATTITLNGYTIKLKADIVVEAGKNIIITDTNENGKVGAIVSEDGGAIVNNGNLNIEGGHFGADTIENNNGEVNITGGTFESNPSDFVDDDYIVVEANGVCTIERKPQDLIDFENAIEKGGNVTLSDDITLLETVVIEEGNTVNLDLNGKTITGAFVKGSGAIIENNGALTLVGGTIKNTEINGDAVIDNTGELVLEDVNIEGAPIGTTGYPDYAVYTYGKLTVENETQIISDRGALYMSGSADVTINGGKFVVTDNVGTRALTAHVIYAYSYSSKLTINDGNFEMNIGNGGGTSVICPAGATINVYGGNFFHKPVTDVQSGCFQNYMGYGAPVDVYGGVFNDNTVTKSGNLAEGYKAVEVKGGYMVVPENVSVVYGDAARTAIKGENATVYVMPNEDGSEIKLEGKLSMAEGVTLIGMGETPVKLFNDWGSNAFANQAHFTNTYIENIHFTNNLVIDAGIANGDVRFVNCVFGGDLAHQGVHFDSGNGTITFENCTFIGRNMFGASLENVVFNNCTFLNKKSSLTGADKWTGVNMWGKYEFNNCKFDTEAHCNVKCDGVVAVFNNCEYVDDRDITTIINNGSGYDATIKFE